MSGIRYLTTVLMNLYNYGDRIDTVGDVEIVLCDVYDDEEAAVRAIMKCLIKNNVCNHESLETRARAIHAKNKWEENYEHYYPNPGGVWEKFTYSTKMFDEMIESISSISQLEKFIDIYLDDHICQWTYKIKEIEC